MDQNKQNYSVRAEKLVAQLLASEDVDASRLDKTVLSLDYFEKLLKQTFPSWEEARKPKYAELLEPYDCYLGEVLINEGGGYWQIIDDEGTIEHGIPSILGCGKKQGWAYAPGIAILTAIDSDDGYLYRHVTRTWEDESELLALLK